MLIIKCKVIDNFFLSLYWPQHPSSRFPSLFLHSAVPNFITIQAFRDSLFTVTSPNTFFSLGNPFSKFGAYFEIHLYLILYPCISPPIFTSINPVVWYSNSCHIFVYIYISCQMYSYRFVTV